MQIKHAWLRWHGVIIITAKKPKGHQGSGEMKGWKSTWTLLMITRPQRIITLSCWTWLQPSSQRGSGPCQSGGGWMTCFHFYRWSQFLLPNNAWAYHFVSDNSLENTVISVLLGGISIVFLRNLGSRRHQPWRGRPPPLRTQELEWQGMKLQKQCQTESRGQSSCIMQSGGRERRTALEPQTCCRRWVYDGLAVNGAEAGSGVLRQQQSTRWTLVHLNQSLKEWC